MKENHKRIEFFRIMLVNLYRYPGRKTFNMGQQHTRGGNNDNTSQHPKLN